MLMRVVWKIWEGAVVVSGHGGRARGQQRKGKGKGGKSTVHGWTPATTPEADRRENHGGLGRRGGAGGSGSGNGSDGESGGHPMGRPFLAGEFKKQTKFVVGKVES